MLRLVPTRALASTLLALLTILPLVAERPRVVVLTDISNEPDDEESLVRYLVYANEFATEGLIATTSTWLRQGVREDLIRRQLKAYAEVQPRLSIHAAGFPTAAELGAVTHSGQDGYGMAAVGDGRGTAGSNHLLRVLLNPDPAPVWVLCWGGANTLAQSLWDLRSRHPGNEIRTALSKLRVYAISDQDDAGAWVRREFPDLMYVVSPSTQDSEEYWRATWTGISGDRFYRNAPGHALHLVEPEWIRANIIEDHGPLGKLYPQPIYIMEGDTPSFLGLIGNGLGWAENPAYGGWGGRYVLYRPHGETRPIWTNNARSRDTVTTDDGRADTSDPATVWRWRQHFQNDFAARMDWCVADAFQAANHNPAVVLNAVSGRAIVEIEAAGGSEVELTSTGTADPDQDSLEFTWWIYPEITTVAGARLGAARGPSTRLILPPVKEAGVVHVILQVQDDGAPNLYAYRRALVRVTP